MKPIRHIRLAAVLASLAAALLTPLQAAAALGSTHPPDSGLVACAFPLSTHDVTATDYRQIRAQFAGSRWPDLRTAGTDYVDLAVQLLTARGTDGYQTVWFYQRLSAACAQHERWTRPRHDHAAALHPITTWAKPRPAERHGREPGPHPAGQPQAR
jgi:hypothetical protein